MTLILLLCMGITLLILITGLIVMIKGGKVNEKWGNKLMTLRVAAQAVCIALVGLIFLFGRH